MSKVMYLPAQAHTETGERHTGMTVKVEFTATFYVTNSPPDAPSGNFSAARILAAVYRTTPRRICHFNAADKLQQNRCCRKIMTKF